MKYIEHIRQIIGLLDRKDRRLAVGLLLLSLVAAIAEVMGIGVIFLFMSLVNDPSIIASNGFLRRLYSVSGLQSPGRFVVAMGLFLVLAFILKNIYLGLFALAQASFVFHQDEKIGHRLLDSYITAPYEMHLRVNPADMVRMITVESSYIVSGVLMPMINLVTESLVLLFILSLLLVAQFEVALFSLSFLAVIGVIVLKALRPVVAHFRTIRILHSQQRQKWVNQALGSVKEMRVAGREDYFMDQYDSNTKEAVRAAKFFSFANSIPRFLVETAIVACVIFVVVLLLVKGESLQQSIPILIVFSLGAVRAMPSVTRIVAATNSIRFYMPSLYAVKQDFARFSAKPIRPTAGAPSRQTSLAIDSIELKKICYRHPEQDRWILNDISLKIQARASVALVGPSGAGKTTLADIILGVLLPTSGSILIGGQEASSVRPALRGKIGYVPQSIYLLDDTVRRNVAFGVVDREIDDQQVWRALRMAQLEQRISLSEKRLDATVGDRGIRLSGGERQRLGIARALYHDPDLVVLDEATSALDNQTERELTDAIAEVMQHRSVIVIAHRIATIKMCRNALFLFEGRIAGEGTYDELLAENGQFREMLQHGDAIVRAQSTGSAPSS